MGHWPHACLHPGPPGAQDRAGWGTSDMTGTFRSWGAHRREAPAVGPKDSHVGFPCGQWGGHGRQKPQVCSRPPGSRETAGAQVRGRAPYQGPEWRVLWARSPSDSVQCVPLGSDREGEWPPRLRRGAPVNLPSGSQPQLARVRCGTVQSTLPSSCRPAAKAREVPRRPSGWNWGLSALCFTGGLVSGPQGRVDKSC